MDRTVAWTNISGAACGSPAGALLETIRWKETPTALKEVYFQPLDSLQAAVKARAGRFVSFANYDYLGLGEDRRCTAGGRRCGAVAGVAQRLRVSSAETERSHDLSSARLPPSLACRTRSPWSADG